MIEAAQHFWRDLFRNCGLFVCVCVCFLCSALQYNGSNNCNTTNEMPHFYTITYPFLSMKNTTDTSVIDSMSIVYTSTVASYIELYKSNGMTFCILRVIKMMVNIWQNNDFNQKKCLLPKSTVSFSMQYHSSMCLLSFQTEVQPHG